MRRSTIALAALAFWGLQSDRAGAQIAFVPGVSAFPNGVSLNATPVVSYDRRYVRLTVNPQFTGLEGFNTIAVPAAVGGGGINGGLGAGAGGFRSVGVPGQTFNAGMDGVAAESGVYAGPYASGDASGFLAGGVRPPQLSMGPGVERKARSKSKSKRAEIIKKRR